MAEILAFVRGSARLGLLMRDRSRSRAPRLTVVVAVRDVEDSIGRDVRDLARHLRQRGLSFQILALGDGSYDTSLTVLRLLGPEIPELRVLGSVRPGHAFRRAMTEAEGEVVLLWDSHQGPPLPRAILGWALARLGRKDAVVVRGRCILANRLRALPLLLHVHGRGEIYETRFERKAMELRFDLDIVGRRPPRTRRSLFDPVRRILSV